MYFEDWLNQNISTPFGLTKRRKCLKNFSRILWSFIKSKGYKWNISEAHLRNCIATGLYENMNVSHLASKWYYSDVNFQYNDDHLNQYHHIFDEETWSQFWSRYGGWEDVCDDNFRGQDRRLDIESFICKQLDIPNSIQTELLDEALYDSDDEMPSTPSGDVYLQEAVEYNGWGGIRR